MKPAAFDYRAPASVPEALALLRQNPEAKLLAGGQSLVPVLNFRLATPPMLVDLNRIAALSGIRETADGGLEIGAMTRHRAVEKSAAVARRNPLLHAAMPNIAHVQIRNRGTIGGSLAHADPAAELPAIAVACRATLVIDGESGRREVPAEDFFQGLFTTALAAGEILAAVRFPAWPAGRRHAFVEVSRRHGDFAIVGVAALADPGAARVVVFGAEDTPRAFEGAMGELPSRAARGIEPRSDHHASADYRRELVEVLVQRALEQCKA